MKNPSLTLYQVIKQFDLISDYFKLMYFRLEVLLIKPFLPSISFLYLSFDLIDELLLDSYFLPISLLSSLSDPHLLICYLPLLLYLRLDLFLQIS